MPSLVECFRLSRRNRSLAVLEGFHAIKHALRFGASVDIIVATEPDDLADLADELAPDIAADLLGNLVIVSPEIFVQLSPTPPQTNVIAIARRPSVTLPQLMGCGSAGPIVFLENPRNLGNLGATVRVAAAAGAAGVLTTGSHDPWHPAALRGSGGLHFALPVLRIPALLPSDKLLIALDPEGRPLQPGDIVQQTIVAFGSERHGLSALIKERASRRVSIPMTAGVSSLNLASAVAVALYSWRLHSSATHAHSGQGAIPR